MGKKRVFKGTKKYFSRRFKKWLEADKESLYALQTMPYSKYLKTKHWKDTRSKRIKKSWNKCDECGIPRAQVKWFEVHHKRYKRNGKSILGRERMSDLLTLCPDCHRAKHPDKLKKYKVV